MSRLRLLLIYMVALRAMPPAVYGQQALASPNGQFVAAGLEEAFIVKATGKNWLRRFTAVSNPKFTRDSRRLIFIRKDSLYVLALGMAGEMVISGVTGFFQPATENSRWVAAELSNGGLRVIDLFNGKESNLPGTTGAEFNAVGTALLFRQKGRNGRPVLKMMDPESGQISDLWSETTEDELLTYGIAPTEKQAAWLTRSRLTGDIKVWVGTPDIGAKQLIGDESPDLGPLRLTERDIHFSDAGSALFVTLKDTSKIKPAASISIWSYQDAKPFAMQQLDTVNKTYIAVINLLNNRLSRLELANEAQLPAGPSESYAVTGHWNADVLVRQRDGKVSEVYTMNEYNWNRKTNCDVYLTDLKTGQRLLLMADVATKNAGFPYLRFTPGGNDLIYYDPRVRNYFSYDPATGSRKNLTADCGVAWENCDAAAKPREYYQPNGIAGWLNRGQTVLLYDRDRDIWAIDLAGHRQPKNITGGYAAKHRSSLEGGFHLLCAGTGNLYLSAADRYERCNNYYKVGIGGPSMPKLLLSSEDARFTDLVKADSTNMFLYTKETSEESPSVWFGDFKRHNLLIASPQQEPLRNRLLHWRSLDGKLLAGRIFFPAHFSACKRYPVICDYYEDNTAGSGHQFFYRSQTDIADIVERGYFYFVPDIRYLIGHTGQSVYNSLMPGIAQLCRQPYIDIKHIGLTGHSFGAYETNLLITRTHRFAAACAGSGLSDMFSNYGTEENDPAGFSHAATTETGQMRMGVLPWVRPDIYLENSPVAAAGKIRTPLLLGIGRKDLRVSNSQSIELFTALRRQGKAAWLLSYSDWGHGLDQADWQKRQAAFFDHYLRGKPLPVWMQSNGRLTMRQEIISPPQRSLFVRSATRKK